MAPEEVKNDGLVTCIGRGVPDKGCGHTQPDWKDGVCPMCGGMLFTPRMRAQSDALIKSLDKAARPDYKEPELPVFKRL